MPTAAPFSRDGCRYFLTLSGLPFETAPFHAAPVLPGCSDVQIKMVFYRGFELLLLDPDVTLGDGGAAVLQELLHQGHIIAIGLVDLGCEEFPEAVGADPLEAEEIADKL